MDLDFTEDIVCWRDDTGNPVTNVPRVIIRHSPDGFEWGYGGSGPTDFALNIMLLFLDLVDADKIYQKFKGRFIANMPKQGGTIIRTDIINWMELQLK
jgi:hypothetical protein